MTFVLGHDKHGHGEADQFGCSGVLPTDAADASHGGYLYGGFSASYTDNGANGQPALTTVDQQIVQAKRQEVEFARTSPAPPSDAGADTGGGQQRGEPRPGRLDRAQQPVQPDQHAVVTFRYAGGAAGVTAGTPRASSPARSPTGPVLTTDTVNATGRNNNTFTSQRSAQRPGFAPSLPRVPVGPRRADQRYGQPQLGRVHRPRGGRHAVTGVSGAPRRRGARPPGPGPTRTATWRRTHGDPTIPVRTAGRRRRGDGARRGLPGGGLRLLGQPTPSRRSRRSTTAACPGGTSPRCRWRSATPSAGRTTRRWWFTRSTSRATAGRSGNRVTRRTT